MKILLVDDNLDTLEFLSVALQTLDNHDVCKTSSGDKALKIIEIAIYPFEIILLDIQMPSMTGIELCQIIRTLPQYRFIPIIMTTAMSEKKYIDQAFLAGATDYLNKPFDLLELKHRINLAEKATFQTKRLTENAYALPPPAASKAEGNHDLFNAIPIDDVNGVIHVHALKSYLKQMNRAQFHLSKILTVTTSNIEAIYDRCTVSEFSDQVADIAEAISDALKGTGVPFISYFGFGVYCIVIEGKYVTSVSELQLKIDDALYHLRLAFRNGDPVNAQIEVAEIVKPTFFLRSSLTGFVNKMVHEIVDSEQRNHALQSAHLAR